MGEIRIGGRNNMLLTGREDKPVMMLANGFGCDQNMWRLVAPALAADFRIVLFDHVGSGQADPSAWQPERYATLDGYVEDILRICHELDLNDVVFVGHSVSAMMGVLAAIAEPERFRKLILIGPSPRYIDDAGYRGGFSASDISELLESDNRADLARVTVPTLILQCTSDVIAPLEVGAYVHAQIPDSTLITLSATGHCPHLSAPVATVAAIRSFAVDDGP
jgi:sigma-B regulation protein RsbQ